MRQKVFHVSWLPLVLALVLVSSFAHAAHPLITDDAGTQGKGKFQIELNGEFGVDEEAAAGVVVKERAGELAAIVSFGLTETVDVVAGAPYQ